MSNCKSYITKIDQYLQKQNKTRILFLGSQLLCKSLTKIQIGLRNKGTDVSLQLGKPTYLLYIYSGMPI